MPARFLLVALCGLATLTVSYPAAADSECGWWNFFPCDKVPGTIGPDGKPNQYGSPPARVDSAPPKFEDVEFGKKEEPGGIWKYIPTLTWPGKVLYPDRQITPGPGVPPVDPSYPTSSPQPLIERIEVPSSAPSITERATDYLAKTFFSNPTPNPIPVDPFTGHPQAPAIASPVSSPAQQWTPDAIRTAATEYLAPSNVTGFNANQKLPALGVSYSQPGGILLAKAAAQRMALNVDIDGAYYKSGMIVLTGMRSRESIDAALFLTAMRLACEPGGDPYFSLDPPDPAAWDRDSERLMNEIGRYAEGRYQSMRTGYYVMPFSLSAERYPALKSELVFKPDWLRQTRFGEIMYKADVLLKELSVGDSVVNPGAAFRGERVRGYVSASRFSVDSGLDGGGRDRSHRGFRLWFDLTPTGDRAEETASAVIYTSGSALDLSDIHPKMFVRRHEMGQDVPGSDPSLNMLSTDVNVRTEVYEETFEELRALTGIFRAYVVALKIAQQNAGTCSAIGKIPLSDGERVSAALPKYRDAVSYAALGKRGQRRGWSVAGSFTVQGGVAIQGRRLYSARSVEKQTPIVTSLRTEIAKGIEKPVWESDGRRYVALAVDMREPPRKVPIAATR